MKNKLNLTGFLLLISLGITAQMDIPSNGFNPRATVSEEVGITSITIHYNRPGVKGREGKIWGDLVPLGFGDYNFVSGSLTSPWRAGANEATTIEFEHDVQVEGHPLKAGKYALFMAIGQHNVTLIFSTQTEAWGSFTYEQSDDVLRIDVVPQVLDEKIEWLKYEFIDHEESACTIAMQWEKLSVPFRVVVDVDNLVIKRIREEFKGLKGFISANRIQASMYYFEKGTHLEEAIGWAERAVTGRPFGQNGFSAYENLANGYEQTGQFEKADSVMQEGLQIANVQAHLNYNKKLIERSEGKQAKDLMESARVRFGDNFPIFEGLFDAYATAGDIEKAREFADKALESATSEVQKNRIREKVQITNARKN